MRVEELEIHDEAAAEYDAAFEWYLERSSESAIRFDQEVHRALSQIVSAPHSWAPGSKNTRRFLLRRFPFIVVYRELTQTRLQVLPFAHCSRNPGYWMGRL